MEPTKRTLPENAYRKLNPGETYVARRPGRDDRAGVHRALARCWALVFAVVFSAAAAYLGLKIGQVFEAAIPITILAIGVGRPAARRTTAAAERDDPVDRLGLGRGRGRRRSSRCRASTSWAWPSDQLPADVPGLAARRLPGHPAS